jgi:hypothetical protein
MKEVWVEIKDHSDYSVSDRGRIKSFKWSKEKILKTPINKQGYPVVTLDGKLHKVHRLVAKAFLKSIKGKNEVNHIDGVKTNNNLKNLEYCTRGENLEHCYKVGLRSSKGELNKKSKLKNKDIKKIVKLSKNLSSREIGQIYNVHKSTICRVIRKETWKHVK